MSVYTENTQKHTFINIRVIAIIIAVGTHNIYRNGDLYASSP